VLGEKAFVLRFFGDELGDRLLLINLGVQRRLESASEPLLAPFPEQGWSLLWCSDARRYGGPGIVDPYQESHWILPGLSAAFFSSQK